jgi:hypothetical protein
MMSRDSCGSFDMSTRTCRKGAAVVERKTAVPGSHFIICKGEKLWPIQMLKALHI